MTRSAPSPRPPTGVGVAFAVVGALVAVRALRSLGLGVAVIEDVPDPWLYTAAMAGGALLCLARVALVPGERVAWLLMGTSLVSWTAGDALWDLLWTPAGAEPPSPNAADALYLAYYALACVGLGALLRARLRPLRAALLLDGLVAGLTLAALSAALVFGAVLDGAGGASAAALVSLAYPVLDGVMLCVVGVTFALTGWRPGASWGLLMIGLAATSVADSAYAYGIATGTWDDAALVSALWPLSLLATAAAAWAPARARAARVHGQRLVAVPLLFALVAIVLLLYAQFASVTAYAGVLAAAGLVAGAARARLALLDNIALLRRSRAEALTDALTGLGNRRRLMADLEERLAGGPDAPGALLFFDLDGFKGYNDSFGHAAGDALLERLAGRLAVAAGEARPYRLGGDEFCVLADGAVRAGDPLIEACVRALSEHGEAFAVTASYGLVDLPGDADTPSTALQLADQRMYARKDGRRDSSRSQARDVLLQVLSERQPSLHEHFHGVARLAREVGRQLDLSAEEIDVLARAAELHEVGKVAVPDAILDKPGPLTPAEWAFVREHTLVGERIVTAAPALRPTARLVRSSHERWDGAGYPDGLAGEAIPLGARIVAVCDAYDAMVCPRPYRRSLSHAGALAELRRCAGTQFDPRVVEALERVARARPQVFGPAASPIA